MFWKVGGFNAPSPVEQILDREEFTLEELLDEDDIIQECKSLNGRLVTFLRERSIVEQLVRYLVDPPLDADDPKRAYKYPFTSCEVFCCEVEAVFNTLLEDPELMALLMSLLDAPPPLSSKTAGYFGRVVGTLLMRKSTEVMQYLQAHQELIEKLVRHVDTASVAEIIKRLLGAEELSGITFLVQYAQWLAETPLVELLLNRLAPGNLLEAQANAADILTAMAHTQPSPLANKLTQPSSVSALFEHALAPGHTVLVPALDVCCALVEPRRMTQMQEEPPSQEVMAKAKVEAVAAIVGHLPKLVLLLNSPQDMSQPMPYGLLIPPLGRTRLKVVELLAVVLRSGSPAAEKAILQTGATKLCLQLFAEYPFNNLLHHCVVALLVAVLTCTSVVMVQYLFEQCNLLDWLTGLPQDVSVLPVLGQEESTAPRPLLRAGYMGHVTQIATTLDSFTASQAALAAEGSQQGVGAEGSAADADLGGGSQGQGEGGTQEGGTPEGNVLRQQVLGYLSSHGGWQTYVDTILRPRQELENTSRWACGRPTATELGVLDSDGDEFQAEMELEHMVGMQPVLFHRYNVDENDEEEDDDEDYDDHNNPIYPPKGQNTTKASTLSAQMLSEGISQIDLNDGNPWQDMQAEAAFDFSDRPQEGTLQGEDQLDPSAEGSHHLSGSGGGSRPGAVEQMQNASMEWGASLADDGVLLAGSPPGSDDESPGIETADRATS